MASIKTNKARGARAPSETTTLSGGVGLTGPAPPSSGSATPPAFPHGTQVRRGSWRGPPSHTPSPAGSPGPHSGPRASEPVGPPKLPSNLSSSSIPSAGSSTPNKPNENQPTDNLLNEKMLQLKCSGLIGQKVDVILRQNQRYEGLLGELDRSGSGNSFGVVLKMARDVSSPHKGVQREIIFPIRDVSDVRPSGTPEGGAAKSTGRDGFQTDTDISRSTPLGQERVLTPWQAEPSASTSSSKANSSAQGDADTFGAPSNGRGWDQFAENEKRFGTRTNYDEDLYTTKLDRSGKDFKERERKAEALAAQIMGTSSSNPHLQEERGQAVDASLGEEDRYSGVARSTNAYVPPGARRPGASPQPSPTPPSVLHQAMAKSSGPPLNGITSGSTTPTPLAHPAPAIVAATAGMARSSSSAGHAQAAKAELPRSAAEDAGAARQQVVPTVRVPSTASTAAEEVSAGGEKSALSAFHEFVKSDRQRLEQKKKQMEGKAKSEKDKRLKELVRFGQDFKLKTTIPDDLVPILAKDAEKQKEIVAKATADALIASTRTSPVLAKSTAVPAASTVASAFANRRQAPGPTAAVPANSAAARAAGKIPMAIQDIPPFNPAAKSAKALAPSGGAVPPGPPSPSFSTVSQTSARLNINAPAFVFKPNPNASAFRPSLPAQAAKSPPVREIPPHHSQLNAKSPKPVAAQQAPLQPSPQPAVSQLPPNPFFGTKPFKRSAAVNVRDDFNPHKLTKVGDSTAYLPHWPYSGKPYRFLFPQDPSSSMSSSDSLNFGGGYHPDGMAPSAISLAAGMAPPHAVSPNLHHAQIHPGMYPQQHGGHMGQHPHYPPYGQFPGAPYRHMSHLGQPGGQYPNSGGPGPAPTNQMPFNSPGRNEGGGGPGGFMPPWAGGVQVHPAGMPPNMYATPHPGSPYLNQPGGSYANGAPGPPPSRGGYYQQGGGSQMASPQMGHVYPNQQHQQQRPPFDGNMGGAGVGSPHGPPQGHFAGGGGGAGPGGAPEGAH